MGFRFFFGKQQNTSKLLNNYIHQKLQHKKTYDEQIHRLDEQLEKEKIDELEYERFRILLETKYYQQQADALRQLQTHIKKHINGFD